jgi:murein DD-endopeptidase MepM/ murein hydrolase activator NlpD
VTGLLFPVKGTSPGTDEQLDPYRAPLVSVFDHSMKKSNGLYGLYKCDHVVAAYTGEVGAVNPDAGRCLQHPGFAQDSAAPFYVNGHYVGVDGDPTQLNYDGHPGIDYRVDDGSEVYAAVSGIVRYLKKIAGIRWPGGRAYNRFHVLELVPDLLPGYKVYYRHLSTHPATGQTLEKEDTTPGCPSPVSLPLPEGTHVNAGCLIALAGQAGSDVGPQLHFEIQRVVPLEQVKEDAKAALQCIDDVEKACVPVDPYGWDGEGPDPYEAAAGIGNIRLWAHRPVINSISATPVAPGILDLTIIGDGFDAGTAEQVVGQSDFGDVPPGTILSRSGTQLIVRESLGPGTYFVHVQNSDQRRSNWKKLEVQ